MLRMIHESIFNLQANMKINVVIILPFSPAFLGKLRERLTE